MTGEAERRLAFWLPKCGTLAAFLVALAFPGLIARSVIAAYAFAIAITGAASATLLLLARRRFRGLQTLSGLILQAGLLILNFAAIHHAYGVANLPDGGVKAISFATALYFSIVTWTTLGYGDYAPALPLQLIAALEAAIGYVYLGLIVGLAAGIFSAPKSSGAVR